MKPPIGTFRKYRDARFGPTAERILKLAASITQEYEGKGIVITLRGIHYQLVGRGLGPNTLRAYNELKGIVGRGRDAGLISWTSIEDRNRHVYGVPFHESPANAVTAAAEAYKIDLWHNQPMRPIVLVEKEAQAAIVGQACSPLRVDYFPCRGYASQTSLWEMGQRCQRYIAKGQRPMFFHLGDHDPSGIDMTRDNEERISRYTGVPVKIIRLMLNMNQIEEWRLPPNPAKMSDARAAAYVAEHGESSYEMDAAPPEKTMELVRNAIVKVRDDRLWDEAVDEEEEDKDRLTQLAEEFGDEG